MKVKKLSIPMTAKDLDYYLYVFSEAAKSGDSPRFHSTRCKDLAKVFKVLCEHKPLKEKG